MVLLGLEWQIHYTHRMRFPYVHVVIERFLYKHAQSSSSIGTHRHRHTSVWLMLRSGNPLGYLFLFLPSSLSSPLPARARLISCNPIGVLRQKVKFKFETQMEMGDGEAEAEVEAEAALSITSSMRAPCALVIHCNAAGQRNPIPSLPISLSLTACSILVSLAPTGLRVRLQAYCCL